MLKKKNQIWDVLQIYSNKIPFVDVRIDSSYKSTKLVKFDFDKGTKVILGVGGNITIIIEDIGMILGKWDSHYSLC